MTSWAAREDQRCWLSKRFCRDFRSKLFTSVVVCDHEDQWDSENGQYV